MSVHPLPCFSTFLWTIIRLPLFDKHDECVYCYIDLQARDKGALRMSNPVLPDHVQHFGRLLAMALQAAGIKAAEFDGDTVRRGGGGFMVQATDGNSVMVVAMLPAFTQKRDEKEQAIVASCETPARQLLALAMERARTLPMVRIRPKSRTLGHALVVTVPEPRIVGRLMMAWDEAHPR